MEKAGTWRVSQIFGKLSSFLRKCMIYIISIGPMPNHIAFIMDGNRRFAKKRNLVGCAGHTFGFMTLLYVLKICYELGVRHVTIYAFSIDNFKRPPELVQALMDFMLERLEGLIKEDSLVNRYGVRLHFIGNLKFLSEPVRLAVERAMLVTAKNSKVVLSICVAYTSTDEIVHAVQESCEEKFGEISVSNTSGASYGLIELGENVKDESEHPVKLLDIEKYMHKAIAPEPDIIIRTAGETRLSNFLLWQSAYTYLYSPSVLWPDIHFHHLLWAILNFQRNHFYLQKRRKQS